MRGHFLKTTGQKRLQVGALRKALRTCAEATAQKKYYQERRWQQLQEEDMGE
jgi:hypothetical protein